MSSQALRNPSPDGHKPRWLSEQIAKAIYETKYPDARWENLYYRRKVRAARIKEAEAVLEVLGLHDKPLD